MLDKGGEKSIYNKSKCACFCLSCLIQQLEIDVIVKHGAILKGITVGRCRENSQHYHSKLCHIIPVAFIHIPRTNRTSLVLKWDIQLTKRFWGIIFGYERGKSSTKMLKWTEAVEGFVVRTFLLSQPLPAVFWCHSVGGVFWATHITLNAFGRPPHTRFIALMRLSMISSHVFTDSYVFFFGYAMFFPLNIYFFLSSWSSCQQNKSFVCVNVLGNKALVINKTHSRPGIHILYIYNVLLFYFE